MRTRVINVRRKAFYGLLAITLLSMSGCFYVTRDPYGRPHRHWGRRREVVVVAP